MAVAMTSVGSFIMTISSALRLGVMSLMWAH
jgi:hypothetical protein